MIDQGKYGFIKVVPYGYEEAVEKTKAALKEQGFGVLAEIDIRKALKEKLDVDTPSYLILGACNPPLAHRALIAEPSIGLLLPCNVTVRDNGGRIEVATIDAEQMMGFIGNAALAPIAAEANDRLRKALEAV